MPLTNQQKQQALRKRRADAGLKEIRGLWVKPEHEAEVKRIVREINSRL